jgi:KAP-like P-loop domain-containing protein
MASDTDLQPLRPQPPEGYSEHEVLTGLLEEALTNNEIVEALAAVDQLSANDLRDRALEDADTILQAASAQAQIYGKYKEELGEQSTHTNFVRFLSALTGLVSSAVFIWSVVFAAYLLASSDTGKWWIPASITVVLTCALWAIRFKMKGRPLTGFIFLYVNFMLGLVTIAAILFTSFRLTDRWWLGVLIAALYFGVLIGVAFLAEVARRVSARPLQRATDAASAEWRRVLMDDGILPYLRRQINATISQDEHILSALAIAGFNSNNVGYITPAAFHLRQLLTARTSGGFAVCGPRGVGKSRLVGAMAEGRLAEPGRTPDLLLSVSFVHGETVRDLVLRLYIALCSAVTEFIDSQGFIQSGPLFSYADAISYADAPAELRRRMRGLAKQAADKNVWLLDQLRMESETTTREVSGTAKAKWIEVGTKASLSRVIRPISTRDIMQDLTSYARSVANNIGMIKTAKYPLQPRLVIIIDGLDQSGIDEAAQSIQALKPLFSVPNCFLIVSVSDNVLGDVGLGGVGLSVALENEFDEIVRVDYLDFHDAQLVIEGRVIGLSRGFVALAYILSGGLPRELIRAVRVILEECAHESYISLSDVVTRLAVIEARQVDRAARDAITSIESGAAIITLANLLDQRELNQPTCNLYFSFVQKIIQTDIGEDSRAVGLRIALAARIYFLDTLVKVFSGEQTDSQNWWEVKSATWLDALAQVRRFLAFHQEAAFLMLNDLRARWEFSTLNLPSGATTEQGSQQS